MVIRGVREGRRVTASCRDESPRCRGSATATHVDESRVAHALGELLLRRKVRDGTREVRVRRAMPADQRADRGQHVDGNRSDRARARRRERGVVNSRMTKRAPGASTRYTSRSAASRSATLRIPNATIAPAPRVVGERQVQRVGDDGRHDRARPCPARRAASARRSRRPRPDPRNPRGRAKLAPHVERSRAEVEVRCRRVARSSPSAAIACRRQRAIDVEAEKMVEKIVARRDLREDPRAHRRASRRRRPAAAWASLRLQRR